MRVTKILLDKNKNIEKNKMSARGSKFGSFLLLKIILFLFIVIDFRFNYATACQFYPIGEYLKFVRVPENLSIGDQVLTLEVHPRSHLTIMPVDKEEDARYFTHKDINATHVAVILAQSLEDLVDSETPRNLLKFRFVCDYSAGADTLALPIQQYFNAVRTNGHAWTDRDRNPTGRFSVTSHLSVTVYVEDVNDHAPQFVGAPYHVTVDEFTPTGLTIFRGIHAFDGDKPNTPNSDVHYAIVKGNEDGKFSLESGHRTALILRKPLDYDTGDREFSLVVTATDRGTPARTTSTIVTVDVIDNDDLGPKFTQDIYRTKIYESFPTSKNSIHKEIHMDTPIHAADQDRDINAPIKYEIISGNDRGLFHIDQKNGTLFLEREIDLDTEKNLSNNTFVLQIHGSQTDNPLKFATAKVEITILDLNDNLPEFEVDFYNISIVENLPNGFSVLQVVAQDNDQNENAEFTYNLDDPSGAFFVDPKNGWLTVRDETVLDREKTAFLRMRVFAVEKKPSVVYSGGKNGSSAVEVEVTLLDANDNNPTFVPSNVYEFVTQSDAKIGSLLGQVQALDSDQGRNGVVKYKIQRTGNLSGRIPFAVDQRTGVITIVESPIIEGRHAIFIEATDQPVNPSERRFSLAVVTVDVFRSDVSQVYEPDFIGSPYEFWVGANVPIGTSVGQVKINDAAAKRNNLIYDLLHSYHEGVPFAVEEKSGTITVVDEIERYDRSSYDFEAIVTDERELTLVTNVSIHVVDPNDQRDLFTKGTTRAPLVFRVRENVAGALIGQVLPRNGTNTSRNIRFFIANQHDVPDISITDDGALYTLKGLDRETRQNYSLTVIAETTRGLGVFQVTIVVDDENDNSPSFDASSYEGHVKENSPLGTEVILTNRITTHDLDDEVNNGNYNLTLEGPGSDCFNVEASSSRIYVEPRNTCVGLDREEKSIYNLWLIVNDGINPRNQVPIVIKIEDVNDNSPTFAQMIVLPDHGIYVTKDEKILKNRNDWTNVENLSDSIQQIAKDDDNMRNDNRSPLVFVPENVTIGTVIIRFLAQDKDDIVTWSNNGEQEGSSIDTITYGISTNEPTIYVNASSAPSSNFPSSKWEKVKSNSDSKPYFVIGSRSGELSIARELPAGHEIRLDITATDTGNLTDHLPLRIFIEDLNDHPPIFQKSRYAFDIPEGIYDSLEIGKIEAIDADFGRNANVSYKIDPTTIPKSSILRFSIGKHDGLLTVTGNLDRETQDNYNFCVIAIDNGLNPMSSRVDLEINVLDVNDNAPNFHGYSEIGRINGRGGDYENGVLGPIYYASVPEDSPVGSLVTKVYANDTDFIGNGNGLILFDIPRAIGEKQHFTIDGKDGLVTIIADLDYETQSLYNLTITARDLGSPSLTSTAMLFVRVLDVEETTADFKNEIEDKPVFQHRYYEVEIEENSPVPVKLMQLNVTERWNNDRIRYGIVNNDIEIQDRFSIDPIDGTLYLIKSVDREIEDHYEIKVKVDRVNKTGRGMAPVMIYPVPNERLAELTNNEAKIVVRIKDTNDNAPRFKSKGRPLLAAIPTSVPYGYEIIRVEAEDPDDGLNGEIRYQILGREDAPRFAIDPLSGQVRSVGSFSRDAGRVFGFDVKATDRRGAENGRSSIANVFVYVLDDHKQVVMVMGKKATDIETEIEEITTALQNVTGLDIRVRKLEPHIEKNLIDAESTDMYLYAVDPNLNVMIDMETLHNVFRKKKSEIKDELERYRVLEIASSTPRRANNRYLLSTLEVGVVVLGCVVFVGALVTALCVTCVRRNKRRHRLRGSGMYGTSGPIGFALTESGSTLRKGPALFPTFVDGLRYDPEPFANEMTTRRLSQFEHEPSCVRHHHRGTRCCSVAGTGKRAARTGVGGAAAAVGGCLEASATSLHSSGQDSGIVARACHCSHSSSPSSGDSSNGYEDSLKSLHRSSASNELSRGHELLGTGNDHNQHQLTSNAGSSTNTVGRRPRLHSYPNLESGMYPRDATLQRETRYRANTEKRTRATTRKNSLNYERNLPEGFNVSRTMIPVRANTAMETPSNGENTNTLHGAGGSSHTLYW